MQTILYSVLVVAGIGLAVAEVVFAVRKNELEEKLLAALPGANCGGCSFAGCAEYAKALATGKVKTTLCAVGGQEGVKKISAILGIEAVETKRKVAFVHCRGTCANTDKKVEYDGIKTCFASRALIGGDGLCSYGCNGYGDCAISVVDGCAVVDCSKCVGCGLCAQTCPKKLITLVYLDNIANVACKNCDRGGDTRKACRAGCIGCGKCARECPAEAITVAANLASVDMDKCTGCGHCAGICPTGAIRVSPTGKCEIIS